MDDKCGKFKKKFKKKYVYEFNHMIVLQVVEKVRCIALACDNSVFAHFTFFWAVSSLLKPKYCHTIENAFLFGTSCCFSSSSTRSTSAAGTAAAASTFKPSSVLSPSLPLLVTGWMGWSHMTTYAVLRVQCFKETWTQPTYTHSQKTKNTGQNEFSLS